MKKLLVICGPTATGKTALAIALARKFNGEIISADSRQVYKGMDIGTGKEWDRSLPVGRQIKIWGYDIVSPAKGFSISQYLKFAKKAISNIAKRGKLPILVGGTGFYIKGVVDGIPTVSIPRNGDLRKNLEGRGVGELFEMLAQIDSVRAGQMNSSDRKNPRRLIRAVEVATWKLEHGESGQSHVASSKQLTLMVGLAAPRDFLDRKISQKVQERVRVGMKEEIQKLISLGVDWGDQSMQALGYRQWRDNFEGEAPEGVVINEWKKEEKKYARRQLTWFKKDKRINWFDVTDNNYPKSVEKLIKKWYSSAYAKES